MFAVRRFLPVIVVALSASPHALGDSLRFRLRFDSGVSKESFTGRVYVMLSKSKSERLPSGPRWVNTEPFFARDVSGWQPGELREITDRDLGFPCKLGQLPKGTYWVRAVMDFNRGARSFVRGPGNGYSRLVKLRHDPRNLGPVDLLLDEVYRPSKFRETERVKLVEIESRLLSGFHKQPTRMRAGVVLPKSFAKNPHKRYPVIYAIPGFSGNHFGAFRAAARNATDVAGVEMLYVVLDPSCKWGHHVFADSDNNGPWGRALCDELIPFIEKRYRAIGKPAARFVTGHSSGGWSSLWLQVTYPDFFGGVWSTAPDPVDFRDFQKVDIYQPENNIFFDKTGARRPLGRRGGKVFLWYKPFSDMESVMGHGGQLGSFEAVFSPRGKDGRPKQLWNRQNGIIDLEVAETWKRYDIRLILEKNWKTLAPKLAGKIHIYMGAMDNFYLDGATKLLKKSLESRYADAEVEIFPGRDHGSLVTRSLRQRIAREMAKQYVDSLAKSE